MDATAAPKGTTPRRSARNGLAGVLSVVYRVTRLVFLLLAAVVLLGIVFTKAPTNPHNAIVSHVLDLARSAAGPFKDVFAPKNQDNAIVINYGLAAVVYVVLSVVVAKLPTGARRSLG